MALPFFHQERITGRYVGCFDAAPGVACAYIDPTGYRDVEILGILYANLQATGFVTLRATGSFEGKVSASHLIVEDGGGLLGEMRIAN
jgi:hypothetical protein